MGLSPCSHVDLEDSPCREVRPVPHTRIQLFGRVEASLEGRNDQIIRWVVVGVSIEPLDGPRKMYVGVDGFGVSDFPKNPAHTTRIIPVLSLKGFQVPYTHSLGAQNPFCDK